MNNVGKKTSRNLVEIFGHAPEDVTPKARKYWELSGGRPFIEITIHIFKEASCC
ncbi:MAG: hypothetical protein FD134_2723 [Gallionellaceae bacterium]|nr:MAG: hypothetical protein FD134_2723 [Gallionellaceae bacterium]